MTIAALVSPYQDLLHVMNHLTFWNCNKNHKMHVHTSVTAKRDCKRHGCSCTVHFTNAMFFLCHEPYTEICSWIQVCLCVAVTVCDFSCPLCVALQMHVKKVSAPVRDFNVVTSEEFVWIRHFAWSVTVAARPLCWGELNENIGVLPLFSLYVSLSHFSLFRISAHQLHVGKLWWCQWG